MIIAIMICIPVYAFQSCCFIIPGVENSKGQLSLCRAIFCDNYTFDLKTFERKFRSLIQTLISTNLEMDI